MQEFAEDFVRRAVALGVDLQKQQVQYFAKYQHLLLQWGRVINLTAIREPKEIATVHFLDSLALVGLLRPQWETVPVRTLLDIGSGAGFPGVVCAIAQPDWKVTLVERIHKKTAFLLMLRRELALSYEVQTIDNKRFSRQFDLVVSRATFPPEEWLRVGAPYVGAKGLLVGMVGSQTPPLPVPEGFRLVAEHVYDVGAGPKLLRAWQRL